MGRFKRSKSRNRKRNDFNKSNTLAMAAPVISNTASLKTISTSRLKTLIVFDTNVLRDMLGKEVVYNSFTFGKSYNELDTFIKTNGLEDYVTLSVSTMVIEELKNQKKRAYKQDISNLKEIVKRLEGLPHIPENSIAIPDEEFDCGAFIEQNATTYIAANNINTLIYKEEHASSILNNMVQKVVMPDKPLSPFAVSSNTYKDAGFKDAVIWETLMHYDLVEGYDKVIFLSKDGDYKENCLDDFTQKWNRHIKIEKDKNNVIAELKKDYDNYIKERTIHDFAQTEYFADYLKDDLNAMSLIVLDGTEYKIENYTIADICKNVNRLPPNEDEVENLLVSSIINIHFTKDAEKIVLPVEAFTKLWDDETKEIISTEYNFELR